MKFLAKVHTPMYDHNDKKYIRLVIPEKYTEIIKRMQLNKAWLVKNRHIDDPLDGRILTVKVPFRYRRVMCEVKGRPVQSLIKDDEVEVEIDFKGVWNVGNYSGFSWIINSIKSYDIQF
jgi:hypothetical protein|tara:strand:+ start:9295 stop:9651 length:357 start_codon:yes stop_codon:yes gene_type:complete